MRQLVDARDKGTAGIRQPYKQTPYNPELPSRGARYMTSNAETTVNYFVFHSGQMSSLSNAVTNVRESLSLQCSAYEYQVLMQDGHLCSEDLVNCFLDQIERHNNRGLKLNAVLSVCPREVAISQAKALDEER